MTPASHVTIPWSPRLQAYNPSDDDERPLRRGLAWDLLGQAGLLDAPGVQVVDPPGMSDEELARVHAPAYIQAVRRYSAQPRRAMEWEATQWGFVPGQDTVARAGMHEAAADVCGASVEGARAVWERGPGSRAFCPAPSGLHHAFANKASGFCIYNDCALAIAWLLDAGAGRVAYVDLDAHHGNGVQWIFHDDPRVLTVSVHEFAHGFYPGTGDVTERGPVGTPGTTVNVPLPPFAGDVAMLAAVERVVEPAVRGFGPDVMVVHLGADVHHADPLTHLQMTLAGMEEMYRRVVALADEVCDGRLLNTAGGGYNPATLGRLWALQLAAMMETGGQTPPGDRPRGGSVPDELPGAWCDAVRQALGQEPPGSLREDPGPTWDADERAEGDRVGQESVGRAESLLSG
jgi:acetoin utilization protein AcuC